MTTAPHLPLDAQAIALDFPILKTDVRGKRLAYLDSGATSQKPKTVMAAMDWYSHHANANIHRGVYQLSQTSTELYEVGRKQAQLLLNAKSPHEIIFTKGCTEAINLVANSWGRANLLPGDVILISVLEHHSNIVPWQLVAQATGARIQVIPADQDGVLDQAVYQDLLNGGGVKLVAVTHVSNVLGTVNPIREMAQAAHAAGAVVLVDGAQAAPHYAVDVQELDADFYAVAAHKMYAPMGVGVLYGKRGLLEAMPPYQGGGDMIELVTFEKTTFAPLPMKFEAGTPNVAAVHGFSAAVNYLGSLGCGASQREKLEDAFARIAAHEEELLRKATAVLAEFEGLTIHGNSPNKSAIISFTMGDIHPHDLATILDSEGVAIRAGHHCCQPLMRHLRVPATARVSFGVYNTEADVEALQRGVSKAVELFK